jgi:hypothetical protein
MVGYLRAQVLRHQGRKWLQAPTFHVTEQPILIHDLVALTSILLSSQATWGPFLAWYQRNLAPRFHKLDFSSDQTIEASRFDGGSFNMATWFPCAEVPSTDEAKDDRGAIFLQTKSPDSDCSQAGARAKLHNVPAWPGTS